MEWKAEIALEGASAGFVPLGDTEEGVPVELEFMVESALRNSGKPGVSVGRIRWCGDNRIHYVISFLHDGRFRLVNTTVAKWPMEIPPDDVIPGEGGDDDGNGDGGGEVKFRIFGRFFDGRRWRKASIGDDEAPSQTMRFYGGVIDEVEAEISGENSARARVDQVQLSMTTFQDQDFSTLIVNLPATVELEKVRDGRYKAVIPSEERLRAKRRWR